jgi:CheY-like chemotaxis protein
VTTEVSSEREPGPFRPRLPVEVISDQLLGIAAWHEARRALERAQLGVTGQGLSREMRLDLDRRMDVIRRQHEAMVQRITEQLADSPRLGRGTANPRAVLVHRNEWYRAKVVEGLRAGGVDVVAVLDNGADAVGLAVAEQPDLLFVEDKLPMIGGPEVISQVSAFAPNTLTAAQVAHEGAVAEALDAGAVAAFARRIPPADVARDLCRLFL